MRGRMRRLEATCTVADTYTRYGDVTGTGHPGSAVDLQSRHLCLRSGRLAPACAQEVGKFGALLRAGVEAPQIIIEQSSSRFSMQVARTPMASILPVWGIAHFAFHRHSGRVHESRRAKAPRA